MLEGLWDCLGEVWMDSCGFFGLGLVSERFADGSYIRGWRVFTCGGWCLLEVISFGGSICYSGPCSSSLALVCDFWVVKVFKVVGGSVSRCSEPFPFDLFGCLHHRISCRLSYFLCAGLRWADYFCFEIGSLCLAAFLFGAMWCFSSASGVRGALLICS